MVHKRRQENTNVLYLDVEWAEISRSLVIRAISVAYRPINKATEVVNETVPQHPNLVSHLSRLQNLTPYAEGSNEGLENRSRSLTLLGTPTSETIVGHNNTKWTCKSILYY